MVGEPPVWYSTGIIVLAMAHSLWRAVVIIANLLTLNAITTEYFGSVLRGSEYYEDDGRVPVTNREYSPGQGY